MKPTDVKIVSSYTVTKHFFTMMKPFCSFDANVLKPLPSSDRCQRRAELVRKSDQTGDDRCPIWMDSSPIPAGPPPSPRWRSELSHFPAPPRPHHCSCFHSS